MRIRPLVLAIAVDAKPEVFAALGAVREAGRQNDALELILDPKIDIRESEYILYAASIEVTRAHAQKFFRAHQEELMKRLPREGSTGRGAGLIKLFTRTCKAEERDAIADYVTKTVGELPGGARFVKENIEAMDQCIAQRKLLEPAISDWLGGIEMR
jgi:hypothetical protein